MERADEGAENGGFSQVENVSVPKTVHTPGGESSQSDGAGGEAETLTYEPDGRAESPPADLSAFAWLEPSGHVRVTYPPWAGPGLMDAIHAYARRLEGKGVTADAGL